MGGEEDRSAPVAQTAHQLLELVGRLGVKTHKGLIHQQQFGVVQQGRQDGQLLLHAVGIGADRLGQVPCQLKQSAVFLDPFCPQRPRHPKYIPDEVEVLDAGHVLVQVGVIGDVGHPPLAGQRVGADGYPVHQDIPRPRTARCRSSF